MSDYQKRIKEVLDGLYMEAVEKRDLKHMELYVSKGAEFNPKVNTQCRIANSFHTVIAPLFHKIFLADPFNEELCKFFIDKGVDVNATNSDGSTLLLLAVINWDMPRAEYLLKHGADAWLPNNNGMTPLEAAYNLSATNSFRQDLIDLLLTKIPGENDPPKKEGISGDDMAVRREIHARPLTLKKKQGGGIDL